MTSYRLPFGAPAFPPPHVYPSRPGNSDIADCLYSYTYIWSKIGRTFWYYPISVKYGEVLGYRWAGRRWNFFEFDPDMIDEVACYPVPVLY